jgi:hypothetical protein
VIYDTESICFPKSLLIDESSYGIMPLMLPPGLISSMHKSLKTDPNVQHVIQVYETRRNKFWH